METERAHGKGTAKANSPLLCGWKVKEEEMNEIVKSQLPPVFSHIIFNSCPQVGKGRRDFKELLLARVTKQYNKAVSLLMRSSGEIPILAIECVNQKIDVDESHRMMSGTVAALIPHTPSSLSMRSPELRDHCEHLIIRLQDPYFRAMLTHLALNDWSEVLEEDSLPFVKRLAIAFQFLDDKAVTSYLRRCLDRAISKGDIDALIVPGLKSKAGWIFYKDT